MQKRMVSYAKNILLLQEGVRKSFGFVEFKLDEC